MVQNTIKTDKENPDPSSKKKIWKVVMIVLLLSIIGAVITCSTITHRFGPYQGRVVDTKTGEPIEGAAVLMRFFIESIGPKSTLVDVVETMTNSKGEFKVPERRVIFFLPLSGWDPNGWITVFKPGYSCYPTSFQQSEPLFMPNGTIPANEYVTLKLLNLETKADRLKNLGVIIPGGTVPDKKMQNLLRLFSIERVNLGLEPLVERIGGQPHEK